MSRHVSDSPTWEEFKAAEARPGVCPCCDGPLPVQTSGRKRVICGSPACVRLFHTVYQRGYWRVRRQSEPRPLRSVRLPGDGHAAQLWNQLSGRG